MNLSTYTITLFNLVRSENRLNMKSSTPFAAKNMFTVLRTSGYSSRSSKLNWESGQLSLDCASHSGSYHQNFASFKKAGCTSRDSISAGLSFVEICLHLLALVYSWISTTRWFTNGFNLFGGIFNQPCTTVESVQRIISSIFRLRECVIFFTNRVSVTAPHSSRRGMVTVLIGATFVSPFWSMDLKNMQPPYARSEESANPCISTRTNLSQMTCLFMVI